MADFNYHSKIHSSYTKALTDLFFFNSNQQILYDQIVSIVNKYGEPVILKEGDYISLGIKGRPDSKCIIVSRGPRLVVAMIYLIEPHDTLKLVHIAIDSKGNRTSDNIYLSSKAFEYLKEVAKRVHANKITILYSSNPLIIDI